MRKHINTSARWASFMLFQSVAVKVPSKWAPKCGKDNASTRLVTRGVHVEVAIGFGKTPQSTSRWDVAFWAWVSYQLSNNSPKIHCVHR